jgi:phosphatidylinositol-3-phosphatase
MRKPLFVFAVAVLLAAMAAAQSTPPMGHIVVVALENHSYSSVVGSPDMPYLNGLISQYGLATGFYSDTHGSIGDYFQITTGQTITTDYQYTGNVSADNIERRLLNAGKTWKSYAQSLPADGYTGWTYYPYAKHHNPFAYFTDNLNGSPQAQNLVQFPHFQTDIDAGALPNFSFIVPDLLHDAHDCPDGSTSCADSQKLAAADLFLQYQVAPVLNNPQFQQDGLLVIWWDEGNLTDNANGGGHVAVVFVGPKVKRGYKSSTFYRNYNLLRTMAEALGIGFPGASATAANMAEFFTGTSGTGAIAGRVLDISNGNGIPGAAVRFSGGSTTADGSGNYRFSGVAPGSYTVTASSSGYFSESATASVTSGATSTANIQLPTGGILAGTVTGAGGAALANATVTATGGKVSTTVTRITSSSGGYNTSWVPVGTYSVTVSAAGYSTQYRTTTVNTGATTTLNVSMGSTSSTSTIAGRITDISTGGPVGGASVTLGSSQTTADSNGYYRFSNVSVGTHSVTAVANGYFSRVQSVTTTAGATSTLNFQLATGGKVQGTVTTSNGAVISGASVSITGGKISTTVNTVTNSSGYYNSNWVPVGGYTVVVGVVGSTTQRQSKAVTVTTGNTATLNFTF